MKKVAILLDGGYAINELYHALGGRVPMAGDIQRLAAVCQKKGEEDLFRVYYYDARPFAGKAVHPDGSSVNFSETDQFASRTRYLEEISLLDGFAFRSGELKFRGWRIDPRSLAQHFADSEPLPRHTVAPNLSQKGVDIKIGLDIAWLATRNVVDRIILFTGDTDFVPAMKYARREGVQVVLAALSDRKIRKELREHSDEFRVVSLDDPA